jgi:hypothetical protein
VALATRNNLPGERPGDESPLPSARQAPPPPLMFLTGMALNA